MVTFELEVAMNVDSANAAPSYGQQPDLGGEQPVDIGGNEFQPVDVGGGPAFGQEYYGTGFGQPPPYDADVGYGGALQTDQLPPPYDAGMGYGQQPAPVYPTSKEDYDNAGFYGEPQQAYETPPNFGGGYGSYSTTAPGGNAPAAYVVVDKAERFADAPYYRDILFMILFYVHLVGLIVLMIIGAATSPNTTTTTVSASVSSESTIVTTTNVSFDMTAGEIVKVSLVVGTTAILGMLLAIIWLFVVRKFARALIYISLAFSVAILIAEALYFLSMHAIVLSIILFFLAAGVCLFFFLCRHRIEFARFMLEKVSELIVRFPNTAWVSFGSLLPLVGFMIFWTVCSALALRIESAQYAVWVYLVFSFFWTTQVIKNVVHVTVAGVFATWYFAGEANMPAKPVKGALKRAMTYSFGSIAFGSLIVAVIKTIRAMVYSMKSARHQLLRAITLCMLRIIDRIVRYFNHYAFTQIAIYGKTYCEAAKSTFHLFSHHGFEAIINDDLVGSVLVLGCLIGASITAFYGAMVSLIFVEDHWILVAVIGFFVGFVLLSLTMEVVYSGVSAIFVCFAEEPDQLLSTDPDLYHKFESTYSHCCDVFVVHA